MYQNLGLLWIIIIYIKYELDYPDKELNGERGQHINSALEIL